jgi:hypothetical protein
MPAPSADDREPPPENQPRPGSTLSTPEATLAAIESAAVGSLSKLGVAGTRWTTCISEVENLANEYVDKLVVEAATSSVDDQIEKLCERIRVRRQALSLSSSSREQILGISKQILAFGGAGLAAALATANNIRNAGATIQSILALVGILYLELTIVSLIVLIVYMLQARYRYPYLYLDKIGNAWPFFYYASISSAVPRRETPSGRQQFEGARLYAEDFARFAYRNLSETPVQRLRAELQQYFLLMSYQAWSHQFSLRLAAVFYYGFSASLASSVLLAIYWFAFR